MRRVGTLAALVLLLAAVVYALWPRPVERAAQGFSLQGLLGGEAAGYAHAESARRFRFPADHGAHPDYRSEWWYLTGNLATEDGRRFGFQFTVFRFALSPQPRPGRSAWGTRQAYMAHLAVTDVETGRFYAFERFGRGALGLAGAQADPFRVWLDDWQLSAHDNAVPGRLQAEEGKVGLRLTLVPRKPLVLQGEQGLSRKGPERGNASYYYSYSRLAAAGEVRLGDTSFAVSGSAWLDREWSTSALSPELAGWDWFALQLDDGSELMLYRLRTQTGEASPFSAGTYVPPQGPPQHLPAAAFRLTATAHWTSPSTGTRYPVGWQLRIPALDTELAVSAAVPGQELDLSVRYWEGAVDVVGRLRERSVRGMGYMELTGYGTDGSVRGR